MDSDSSAPSGTGAGIARWLARSRPGLCTSAALAALAIVWLAAGAACVQAAPRAVEKGVSFTGYSNTCYEGRAARASMRHLKATGATWAMVLVTIYQDDINSTSITRSGPQTPTDAALQEIIAYAHRIGLKVMLKPQLDLLDDPTHCRSQIGPDFSSGDWAAWFASYDAQIVHYANLAAATHCEQFCVGCELDSSIPDEAAWRQVISDVRAVYGGKLTYAADLWSDSPTNPHNPQFWDALDYIGVDMYPTLSNRTDPSVAQLVAGWQPVYAVLAALHERWGKPVIFTEIGIRSIRGAARAPWDWCFWPRRPDRPDAVVPGSVAHLHFPQLDGRAVLVAMVVLPERRRSGGRQLLSLRQAG